MCRLFAANIRFCTRYPLLILAAGLIFCIFAIFAFITKGVDTSGYGSQDSVHAQIEFDSGLAVDETDRLLAAYSETLVGNIGIINVETGAKTGSGSLFISFDPKKTKAHLVRDLAKQTSIPGGFVFFHENSAKDRYWEINIYGDEDNKCRELAEELTYICSFHPLVKERILNFKQGNKKLILLPDRQRFAEAGIGFSNVASGIRLGVYGPVTYKRMTSNGEIDVRVRTGNIPTKEEILNSHVSSLRVDSLMLAIDDIENSGIRRTDRRRTASITISTKPMDPRRVKQEISPLFNKLDLPPGYSVEFDPDAIKRAQDLSTTAFFLVLVVFICYMIIAAINESFIIPLFVLSAIPPSLALPALFLVLTGSAYNSAIACAFIAVSGMTVNASVLCVDSLKRSLKPSSILSIYTGLRKKIPALLATTCTTIAGALPFLFLTEGANILIRTLALVGALGVACSFICSITVIPSFFILLKDSACAENKFRFGSLT